MKTNFAQSISALFLAVCLSAYGAEDPSDTGAGTKPKPQGSIDAEPQHVQSEVAIEATDGDAPMARKDMPWLGLSTDEASEALTAQLDLTPGVGLVVTYVAPESPAAKASLKKNDVLVRLDDQALVHPAQLRKLVQVRKAGDTVKLAYYRAGKQETASATLGQAPASFFENEGSLRGGLRELESQFKGLHIDEAVREQMKALRQSMGDLKVDQKQVQVEIRHSMEQARKAIQEALRNVTNADAGLGPLRKVLESLAQTPVMVGSKSSLMVHSSGKGAKSLVKTDDSGTIVLIQNPQLRLTAHDKEGKLLFDGEIETPEQRNKVPREVWDRVEPLLDKMHVENAEEPASKDKE